MRASQPIPALGGRAKKAGPVSGQCVPEQCQSAQGVPECQGQVGEQGAALEKNPISRLMAERHIRMEGVVRQGAGCAKALRRWGYDMIEP